MPETVWVIWGDLQFFTDRLDALTPEIRRSVLMD
jgi:hypothetical protein